MGENGWPRIYKYKGVVSYVASYKMMRVFSLANVVICMYMLDGDTREEEAMVKKKRKTLEIVVSAKT